jgi:hypothetical protein
VFACSEYSIGRSGGVSGHTFDPWNLHIYRRYRIFEADVGEGSRRNCIHSSQFVRKHVDGGPIPTGSATNRCEGIIKKCFKEMSWKV